MSENRKKDGSLHWRKSRGGNVKKKSGKKELEGKMEENLRKKVIKNYLLFSQQK